MFFVLVLPFIAIWSKFCVQCGWGGDGDGGRGNASGTGWNERRESEGGGRVFLAHERS